MKLSRKQWAGAALCVFATIPQLAQAALVGRDLDGNAATFEAYYDTVLNISWLTDANYANTSGYDNSKYGYDTDGKMYGDDAKSWASGLNYYGITGWRLPTTAPVSGPDYNMYSTNNGATDTGWNITSPNSEMAYMFYVTLGNKGYCTANGSGSSTSCNPQAGYGLTNTGPFSNLAHGDNSVYWSDTSFWGGQFYFNFQRRYTSVYGQPRAEHLIVYDGDQAATGPWQWEIYAWAVHDGDVGATVTAVPEPETYAMMLAGLGLLGFMARRRKQKEAAAI